VSAADAPPSGWTFVTVGDVAEIRYGRALPSRTRREGGRVPVYSSAGQIDAHDEWLHPDPAVVVGRKGTVGSVFYVDGPFWPIDTAYYLVPLDPALDVEYLAFALRAMGLGRLATGAGVPGLAREALARQRLALPPRTEQREIAEAMRAAHAVQGRVEQADAISRMVPGALFAQVFGDPGANPRHWPRVGLEELLEPGRGMQTGPYGTALRKADYTDHGVPVWGIENVGENEFHPVPGLYVSPARLPELQQFAVHDGDVLVSRAGTAGRMAVARTGGVESIIGTNLIRVSLNPELIVPEYFTTLATSFGESVGELRASGSGYTFTRPSLLRRISLPLPPLALQQEFLAALHRFQAYRVARRAAEARVDHLLQVLNAHLFSGALRLRTGGATPEPALPPPRVPPSPLPDEKAERKEAPQAVAGPPAAHPAVQAEAEGAGEPQAADGPRRVLVQALGPAQRGLLTWIEQSTGYLTAATAAEAEPLRALGLTPARLRQALAVLEHTGLVQRVSVPQRVEGRDVDRFVPAYRKLVPDRDTAADPLAGATP
jgi:type I restriction enzyme S subunit